MNWQLNRENLILYYKCKVSKFEYASLKTLSIYQMINEHYLFILLNVLIYNKFMILLICTKFLIVLLDMVLNVDGNYYLLVSVI